MSYPFFVKIFRKMLQKYLVVSQNANIFASFSNPKTRTNLSNNLNKYNTAMKKIVIDIKKPYSKYLAFSALRSNIENVYDKLEVADDECDGSVLQRIDGIMRETEYYHRGDFHRRFDCTYRWQMLPNRIQPERITITSITDKEVGSITIK